MTLRLLLFAILLNILTAVSLIVSENEAASLRAHVRLLVETCESR